MGRLAFFTLTTLLFCISGCGGTPSTDESAALNGVPSIAPAATKKNANREPLTPEETLARLAELARAGDWEAYVDDFYGEAHKFEGKTARRDALVARFRDQWAETVVAKFGLLEGKSAKIIEDGKQAVFHVDDQPAFTLFLSEDGKWTFHL